MGAKDPQDDPAVVSQVDVRCTWACKDGDAPVSGGLRASRWSRLSEAIITHRTLVLLCAVIWLVLSPLGPCSFGSLQQALSAKRNGLDREPGSILSLAATLVAPYLWGGLAARVGFLTSGFLTQRADRSTFVDEAVTGINVLQQWYDQDTGLWKTTGWWNSANCLTVLVDFALLEPGNPLAPHIANVIANTFANAQQVSAEVTKALREGDGLVRSMYTLSRSGDHLAERGFPGFINEYYDDEGWWALALLHSYDFTGDATYLRAAEIIFADMAGGEDGTCGGGIWWSKARTYKNAIANELYLAVAAALANRASAAEQRSGYLRIATAQWDWFRQSGMINAEGTINDGLFIHGNGTCSNNGATVWSYNQGVILGALVELYRATGDWWLLKSAADIATAAIDRLTDSDGILHEPCEPDCGADGPQFKGIFVRNLGYLQDVAPQHRFSSFIDKNAESIMLSDTDSTNQYGLVWSGPPTAGGRADASTHSSALDAIVAAVAVS